MTNIVLCYSSIFWLVPLGLVPPGRFDGNCAIQEVEPTLAAKLRTKIIKEKKNEMVTFHGALLWLHDEYNVFFLLDEELFQKREKINLKDVKVTINASKGKTVAEVLDEILRQVPAEFKVDDKLQLIVILPVPKRGSMRIGEAKERPGWVSSVEASTNQERNGAQSEAR